MQQVMTRSEMLQVLARKAMRGDHGALVTFKIQSDPDRDAKRQAAVEAYRQQVAR